MQTPYFVIDEQRLEDNLRQLRAALSQSFHRSIVGYSFKTNALPWVIEKMRQEGVYAEVVSDDEYELAQLLGYPPSEIIYNGPAKSEASFAAALAAGAIVNLETHRELRWLEKYGRNKQVGLRLQLDIETLCPGESAMGELGGRFGFQLAELPELLALLARLDVRLAGLHLHTSSKTRSVNIYRTLAQEAAQLIKQYELQVDYIDIGGGFFGGLSERPNFFDYMAVIEKELRTIPYFEDLTVIVEPGASLIATPISYVTSVIDVKKTPRNYFVTTDGSRTNIDPFLRKNSYDYTITGTSRQDTVDRQIIAGFTCMENDHLFQLEEHPLLEEGQQITYHKVGSYSICFNPLFIKYFPDVYVKNTAGHHLVRKRWTAKEFLQGAKR